MPSRRGPRVIRALGIGSLVAGGLLALPACSSDGDRLTVYSGRTEDLIGPLLERFSDDTGIAIDVRYGDSADLAQLIDTEGGRSPADVFISQSPGAVAFLDEADRLAPLGDDVLASVPDEDEDGDGNWVGITGRVRVLVYNVDTVDVADLPASVFDLTAPQYEGRVGVAPGNGSFQDFVTAMRQTEGEDETRAWLEGMAANDAQVYPNNVSIVEAVGRGEIELGLVNHYYNERAKAEDPGVASENHFFAAGDLGGLLLVTAASIVDGAAQGSDGERLVEYLLGQDAQRYFATETQEYPLAAGVEPDGDLPPLDSLNVTRIDFDELGGLARTEELIERSGITG